MQATGGMAAKSKANLSVSDIICVLQDILASSQVTILDLGAPYSQASPLHTNYPVIELKDRPIIGSIIAEYRQELDAVSHEISGLKTVMDSINNLHYQVETRIDSLVLAN